MQYRVKSRLDKILDRLDSWLSNAGSQPKMESLAHFVSSLISMIVKNCMSLSFFFFMKKRPVGGRKISPESKFVVAAKNFGNPWTR